MRTAKSVLVRWIGEGVELASAKSKHGKESFAFEYLPPEVQTCFRRGRGTYMLHARPRPKKGWVEVVIEPVDSTNRKAGYAGSLFSGYLCAELFKRLGLRVVTRKRRVYIKVEAA